MVTTMQNFKGDFFKGEWREGYFVEEKMKRVWAAEIEVLNAIDEICNKNGILYYADSGTLLGVIRHKGFIPWDNDIDIVMERDDYRRFLAVAAEECKEKGLRIVNAYSEETYDQAFTKVCTERKKGAEERYLEKYHGCPDIVGVDVFPLDYLPSRKEEEDVLYLLLQHCMGTIWKIKKKDWAGLEKYICEIEEMCKVQIAREKNVINQLLILMDRLACLYSKDEADELALFMYRPDKERKYHYKKEWYAESVRMPFENITIPVPTGYRDILRVLYGEDYMVPQHWKRDCGE